MSDSANLSLPYIAPSQAQKHVTHNEALDVLDTLAQLAVVDRDLSAPPASPANGARYIVKPTGTGAWAGENNRIACFRDGTWRFFAPKTGWLTWIVDEDVLAVWTGSAWSVISGAALQNLSLLGVGTTADATNPFAAKLNNALWTAKTVAEGGDGDLRYKMNKETAADVLSLLLQTNFSGRAELGLLGEDNFGLKVSNNGSDWYDAIQVDRFTGNLAFTARAVAIAAAATCDIGAITATRLTVSGATPITSFGTAANQLRVLHFAAGVTLTHNATTLILPGGANIVTQAGDGAVAASDTAGNWRVLVYQRASGKALVAPAVNELSGGAVGSRRNAFANPFFDVAQGYSGPITGVTGGFFPIDLMNMINVSDGQWSIELVDFAPGQTDVPGNPRRFPRITQTAASTTARGPEFMMGSVETLAGKQATFSFWGKVQSGTLNVRVDLAQRFGSGGSASVFDIGASTITLTTAWQRFTITTAIPSMSGKTIGPGSSLKARIYALSGTSTIQGDFCGMQLEEGGAATSLNEVSRLEAETLCRYYYEQVPVRAINSAIWVPCQRKRATPTVSSTVGTVSNATANGCLLTHTAGADAIVTFDARL